MAYLGWQRLCEPALRKHAAPQPHQSNHGCTHTYVYAQNNRFESCIFVFACEGIRRPRAPCVFSETCDKVTKAHYSIGSEMLVPP